MRKQAKIKRPDKIKEKREMDELIMEMMMRILTLGPCGKVRKAF